MASHWFYETEAWWQGYGDVSLNRYLSPLFILQPGTLGWNVFPESFGFIPLKGRENLEGSLNLD